MDIGRHVRSSSSELNLAGLRDFVQASGGAGLWPICVFLDHVLGADPQFHPEVPEFPYTHRAISMNALTLMAILPPSPQDTSSYSHPHPPQRQTALSPSRPLRWMTQQRSTAAGIGVGVRTLSNMKRSAKNSITVADDARSKSLSCERCDAGGGRFQRQWHQINHAGLNPMPVAAAYPHLDRGRQVRASHSSQGSVASDRSAC